MKRHWILFAAILLAGSPLVAEPRTWHILNDGAGDAPTVQAGIDSAAVNDTVLVGPGMYLENLSIVGKDLVLKGEMGPEATILGGSSQQDAVVYLSGQTRAMVIEGFGITGGTGRLRGGVADGGGIHLTSQASPTIRGNHIYQNGVSGITFFGGGVAAWTQFASPLIENNTFEANHANLGGAISTTDGDTDIRNNIFTGNTCLFDGGGVYAVFNSGNTTIEGNQFWENVAGDHGGAIHIGGTNSSMLRLVRNLLVKNTAQGSAGDNVAGPAVRVARVQGVIAYNTLADNIGRNSIECGGGALSLQETPSTLEVYANVIANNQSCGITCRFDPANSLGQNLFWANDGGDFGHGGGDCPSTWASNQIFADPLFCEPEMGNYTVSIESPALTGPVPMGVWTTPGCGPGVPTRPTTWGHLKAMYR